jgi:anaphase-promoting complex subunit 1
MSHGQEGASINYGSHMAMHMAMGMLYLGRGYYTLGNSNLAIASLAISCFPRFLPAMGDNKAYPQAFRHLWALAVEPRCLIARDVDTRESIFLPVKLVKRAVNQSGVVPSGLTAKMMSGGANPDSKANLISNHISPTLIPPMDTLRSIIIDSPRYLPVTLDFDDPRDWATTIATRTVWVKRRAGYIDYAADPRGYRSLMVRAGTMSGFDMHYDLVSPAAPMTVPPADVIELVTTHSTNPVCIAIARNFSGATWLERFARNVLFECLSIDKLVMLGTYLSMALGLQAKDDDGLLLERIAHARLVHRFYRPQTWDKFFSLTAAQKRHPVVRQTFLAALVRNLGADDAVPAWDSTADNTFLARSAGPPSRFAYFAGVAAVGDVALSAYLVRNDVPPMRVLELLRDNVSASAVSTAGGGADKNAQVLVLQCRAVAERYLRAVVGAYAAEAGDVPRWSLDSVMDAIGVWTEGV